MFLSTANFSYCFFNFFGWRTIADFNCDSRFEAICDPLVTKLKNKNYELDVWNGYERFCAADF